MVDVGTSVTNGQIVEIRGYNLNLLPDDAVMLYNYGYINTQSPNQILRLVSKTNSTAQFQFIYTGQYNQAHTFTAIAYPYNVPRIAFPFTLI